MTKYTIAIPVSFKNKKGNVTDRQDLLLEVSAANKHDALAALSSAIELAASGSSSATTGVKSKRMIAADVKPKVIENLGKGKK